MLIIVLVKEALEPHISEISKSYAGVGLMGVMVMFGLLLLHIQLETLVDFCTGKQGLC